MTHIDEGRLQAYLDEELHLEERWRTEQHLQQCARCQQEMNELSARASRFTSAMRLLDSAPSLVPAGAADAVVPLPVGAPAPRRGAASAGQGMRRMVPRAAMIFLFAGAAASATVPGSPVREWIEEIVAPSPDPTSAESAPSIDPGPMAAESVPEAGVFVDPLGGAVSVVLRDAREVSVRTRLVDGSRAGVSAVGEAAGSQFTSGAGRVEVRNTTGGELWIEIPRVTTSATIIINDDVVLQKQDSRLDLNTDLPRLHAAGIAFSVEN